MRRPAQPGFLLVATRELRRIRRDKLALFLLVVFPVLAFTVLSLTFSRAVIRDLNTIIVDADRTATSMAYVEFIQSAPGVTVSARANDLSAAMRAIRSGDAIAAVYIPANFEHDVGSGLRPQISIFYNVQFMTPANAAQKALNDAIQGAIAAMRAPAKANAQAAGSLLLESYVLTNPALNYAQFLLRALLPVILHVVIVLATIHSVGSEFSRRSFRTWLRAAGGSPLTALIGKCAPLFAILVMQMMVLVAIIHGVFAVPFRGDAVMVIAAALMFIAAYQGVAALLPLLVRNLPLGLSLGGLIVSPSFGYIGVSFPPIGMAAFARSWSAVLPLRWYIQIVFDQGARGAAVSISAAAFATLAGLTVAFSGLAWLRLRSLARSVKRLPPPEPIRFPPETVGLGPIVLAEIRRVLSQRGVVGFLIIAPIIYGVFYPQPYLGQILRDIPIAVVDHDRTEMSRELARTLDADGATRVALETDTLLEAERALLERKIFGIVEIPERSANDVLKGDEARIPVYVDSAYFLVYSTTLGGIAESIATVNANFALRGAREQGIAKSLLASASPVAVLPVPLFNPTGGDASYIVPAAFILILQQTLLMGAATLGGMAFVFGGSAARSARGAPMAVLGHGLAHLIVVLPAFVLYLAILPRVYGFATSGRLGDVMIFTATFILAVSFFGQAVGQWLKRPEAAVLIFLGTSIPQIFLTGVSWPQEAIPPWLREAGNVFPSEAAITGLVRINQMGASLQEVSREWVVLAGLACFYFVCAILRPALARSPAHAR